MRRISFIVASALTLSRALVCWAGDLDRTAEFHIAAQPLPQALLEFSRQSDLQVVSNPGNLANIKTAGLSGRMSIKSGLEALLMGTGLSYTSLGGNTIAVQSAHAGTGVVSTSSPTEDSKETGKKSSQDFRVAQATAGQNQGTVSMKPQAAPSVKNEAVELEEITVTAQKREERLQEVPVPLTVLNTGALVDNDKVRLQDYYATVPGLSLAQVSGEGGLQYLTLRGISSVGGGSPTVGVLVDDVSYGTSQDGVLVPDIDPGDLARIEVLRGPQGTLYGASSMGGLIKYVTLDPSTDAFSGRVEAGANGVHNGSEPGYDFRASFNIPLTDTLALRAGGFTRQDAGYINNPILGIKGINEDHASGGHLTMLWRPLDNFSLRLSAMYQHSKADGNSGVEIEPGLGDLQQNYPPGVGPWSTTVQAYSATMKARVGTVDVVSLTGYNRSNNQLSFDYTYALGGLTSQLFPVGGAPVYDHFGANKFTQELRFSSSLGSRLDWLVGGFYTHESHPFSLNVLAENLSTGAISGQVLDLDTVSSTYQEYAGFADLTYHFTDRIDLQIGGRESRITQSTQQDVFGAGVPFVYKGQQSPLVGPTQDSQSDSFTYMATPRFKVTSDLMLYARFASGFRAGGANAVIPNEPAQYGPDKTENYELGLKGTFLDRTLSVDASVYYIDWSSIQVAVNAPPPTSARFTTNAGQARSDGVEVTVESNPLRGLTLGGWIAFNDAVLTKDFPERSTIYGLSGDRLPFSSRLSGNVSLRQDFPVSNSLSAFAGALLGYTGDSIGNFSNSPLRQRYPSYVRGDLQAGITTDAWTVNVFLNNVTDKRVIVSGGIGYSPPNTFSYLQPRTVGISVTRRF